MYIFILQNEKKNMKIPNTFLNKFEVCLDYGRILVFEKDQCWLASLQKQSDNEFISWYEICTTG